MKENLDIFSSNLINNDINNNIVFDSSIKKLQQNLFLMGFDILMINKIISYFNITTESEAIDYLIKDENGMWNHPFIPKEKFKEQTENSLLNPQKIVINNVFTRFKSNSLNENANNNIVIDNDICDICEESIDFHNIKNYEIKNKINDNNEEPKDSINLENKNNNIKNKNILIDEEEEEEEEKNKNECPICMGDFENSIEIEKCKHKFCYGCFNSYLNNLIIKNQIQQISCPKYKCPNNNLSEEFFSQYLSEEQYFKYRQFKSKNEIAKDPKKIFCPHCDSYAQLQGLIPDPNSKDYVKFNLKCQKNHEFCSCGRPLHEGSCFKDEQEFKELIVSEKIKKCPKCGFFIKKNAGCNHMTCGNPNCKFEFCWLCLNEAVPDHYNYGPCAGLQFYDPDSFANRLRQTHPRLSIIVSIFMVIVSILNFLVSFVIFPAIGSSVFYYFLIFIEDEFNIRDQKIKVIQFLICICVSISSQSLTYMFWILFLVALSLVIVVTPIAFIGFACWFYIFGGSLPNREHDLLEMENLNFDDNEHQDSNVENNQNENNIIENNENDNANINNQ